jgi:hypothetical protein
MKVDNEKITSNNREILQKSLETINEHLEKERRREETAERRANMLITFIGIGATIILALSKNFINSSFSINILVKVVFGTTLIFLTKSIFYTLKVFSVKQINRLTPELINDIQDLDLKEALAYEIKWKIWEYNQMIPVNTEKLFWVSRAIRNFILAIISALLLSSIIFIDRFITIESCWLITIQICLGIIIVLYSILVDYIFEKFSFWEFE